MAKQKTEAKKTEPAKVQDPRAALAVIVRRKTGCGIPDAEAMVGKLPEDFVARMVTQAEGKGHRGVVPAIHKALNTKTVKSD